MESHDETEFQAQDRPILCINNCGFFGSAATMNMCSKCHKEMILKQQQAKIAVSSIESIVNSGPDGKGKEPVIASSIDLQPAPVETKAITMELSSRESSGNPATKKIDGPKRCTTCQKRVGLTGFNCKCGNLFCATHRYSDEHDCPFDYHTAAQNAIAKANPVVKAEKLDKI